MYHDNIKHCDRFFPLFPNVVARNATEIPESNFRFADDASFTVSRRRIFAHILERTIPSVTARRLAPLPRASSSSFCRAARRVPGRHRVRRAAPARFSLWVGGAILVVAYAAQPVRGRPSCWSDCFVSPVRIARQAVPPSSESDRLAPLDAKDSLSERFHLSFSRRWSVFQHWPVSERQLASERHLNAQAPSPPAARCCG